MTLLDDEQRQPNKKMTTETFNQTKWHANMKVTYYGQTHHVVSVDFVEQLIGMRGVLQSKDEEILWARCENVTLEVV